MSIVSLAFGLGIGNATVAMKPADVKAITTSLTRAQNLALENYTFTRVPEARDLVYEVKGPDTIAPRSGKITTHGPYLVNLSACTCECPAFANRGECPHVEGTRNHHEGKSVRRAEVLEKEAWALREVNGDRLRVERDAKGNALILVWRSSGLALDEATASAQHGEELEITELDMKAAMADGRYAGIRHVRRSGDKDVYFGTGAACSSASDSSLNTDQAGRSKAAEPGYNPWAPKPQPYLPGDEEMRESARKAAQIARDY